MFLEVLVGARLRFVLHPRRDGELGGEVVVQHRGGNGRRRRGAVELEHLVRLAALVRGQAPGPLGPLRRPRQEVDGVGVGAAQLPLALHRVGVAVAALADVRRRQDDPGLDPPDVAGAVAQLQARHGGTGPPDPTRARSRCAPGLLEKYTMKN